MPSCSVRHTQPSRSALAGSRCFHSERLTRASRCRVPVKMRRMLRNDQLSCALNVRPEANSEGQGEPRMLRSWDHTSAHRPALVATVRQCGTRHRADRALSASVAAAITCGTCLWRRCAQKKCRVVLVPAWPFHQGELRAGPRVHRSVDRQIGTEQCDNLRENPRSCVRDHDVVRRLDVGDEVRSKQAGA